MQWFHAAGGFLEGRLRQAGRRSLRPLTLVGKKLPCSGNELPAALVVVYTMPDRFEMCRGRRAGTSNGFSLMRDDRTNSLSDINFDTDIRFLDDSSDPS